MSDKANQRLKPLKGRGSQSHVDGRFEERTFEASDDGWGSVYEALEEAPALKTTVTSETARSIISTNQSPDVPFNHSVNPYRGCEHGCVYCFARTTHSYLGLSPGLDFETKLFAKDNAAEKLLEDLSKPSYIPSPIALGINTDGYQPIEREREITRACLQVLADSNHPLSIVTKGHLVERDIDLLAPMAAKGLAHVFVSITSLDNKLSSKLEPRATAPHRRLQMLRNLSDAGIPTGVLVAPVIPMITDMEFEHILEASKEHGALCAGYVMLRLPHELRQVWREWLQLHYPDRADHVMSLLNQMHGGKDYSSQHHTRMKGQGVFADLLRMRFAKAKKRYGLQSNLPKLRTDLFVKPRKPSKQGDLFG